MKRHLSLLALLFIISISSCEKTDQEVPGKIPGMGNYQGELVISEKFTLPQGVILIGKITGLSGDLSDYFRFGSGKAVRLEMILLNTTDLPRTAFFPKGLIFKSDSPDYQSGILLQTAWICVEANSERTVLIDLYCINYGLPGPDKNATYTIAGVTGSEVIGELLDLIAWKGINYEMIHGIFPGESEPVIVFPYSEITDRLQTVVHNLTAFGIGLSSDNRAFIDSIPEISSAAIPQKDASAHYPTYFAEFAVSKK